jgi:hypothetical protein
LVRAVSSLGEPFFYASQNRPQGKASGPWDVESAAVHTAILYIYISIMF